MMIWIDVAIVLIALIALGTSSRGILGVLALLLIGRALIHANNKRISDKFKE